MQSPQNESEIARKISDDIDESKQELLNFFTGMLAINAVNPRMAGPGEQKRARYVRDFLESSGIAVTQVDVPDPDFGARPSIRAEVEGKDKSTSIVILSHLDTVPEGDIDLWHTDPFKPVIKDGKIFARGSVDNGQSLAASVFALRELKKFEEELPVNFVVWCVADEEFGSDYGIKYLLKHGQFDKRDLVIVPDAGTPQGDSIEIAEKGLLWFKIKTIGKQVHASLPKNGLNAHRIGMKLALALDFMLHQKYPNASDLYDDPVSTFEPTKVESNVPNINTVPGTDVFCFDCRVLPEYSLDEVISDVDRVVTKFGSDYPQAKFNLEVVQRGDAGPATKEDSTVAKLLSNAVLKVGGKQAKFYGIGGQTVGNLFRREGMPTAVWSTVDEIAHEPNEFCRIENLISDSKVFALLPFFGGPHKETQ